MTDLQTSLIGIGGAIVVGVILYNKLHERKIRKNVERAFSGGPDDVLMSPPAANEGGERMEPTLDLPSALEAGLAGEREPSLEPNGVAAVPAVREVPVDPRIDCIIPIEPDEPVRGEKLLPLLLSLRHVGGKPVHYIGMPQEAADESWEAIAHGGVYRSLRAGVQLAGRSGPLNEIEYSELVMRLRQVADGIGAEPEVPDMPQVMAAARTLYQFVSDHDARLSINVRSNGAPWSIATVIATLERLGFDLRPDGNFVMRDSEGGILYFLSTNVTPADETASLLTLLLDVPCVAPQRSGFMAMVGCAKSLCQRLDGMMVDDGGQPLIDPMLEEISGQVDEFCAEMEAAGIPAGSTRALRLFVR
jgi:hypothetical protein